MKTVGFVSVFLTVLYWLCLSSRLAAATEFPDLYEASVLELKQGLDNGDFTSVDLVKVGTKMFS